FKSQDFDIKGIPIIKIKNVASGQLIWDDIHFFSKSISGLKQFIIQKDDILIAMTGSHITQISSVVGKVTRYNSNHTALLNQRVGKIFSMDENKLNNNFLYYFMVQPITQYKLAIAASGSANQANISSGQIKNLLINLPPLEEQKKIAAVLSSLDAKIDNLRRQNETLEKIAQTLFKHWFIDFEFPNNEGKPYKSSGGVMVNSELKEIPAGWSVGKLKDLGKIVCGKTPSKSNNNFYGGEIPFIKIPDMHGNIFVLETNDKLSPQGSESQINKLLPPYSINISCIATVGLVTINTKKSHTNQQINSIILNNQQYLEYLYFRLKSLSDYLNLLGSGGTATLNVNTNTFSNIEILVPQAKTINEYHKIVNSIFSKIESNLNQIQTLTKMRDELLPKLMSGEIRV
ncbi:MAG TPA: restriction endonuclease subunit S, partial [Allocoleopsis sp.]